MIYTMKIDGTGLRALRRGSAPAWSNDGRHIVFTSGVGRGYEVKNSGIAVMRPNGTEFRRLVRSESASPPSFSPDGQRVLYTLDKSIRLGEGPLNMQWLSIQEWREIDVSGRHERLIIRHQGTRFSYCPPQWAPDGTHLASMRIETMADSSTITALVTVSPAGDNEQVAFVFPPSVRAACRFSWQPL
jgi:Tol biopolymer transport system component